MIFVFMLGLGFSLNRARHSPILAIFSAKIAVLSCAVLLLVGCGKQTGTPLRFQVRGVIQGLPPDHHTVAVEHEDIPGFMPSMTMPFTARDETQIAGLKVGDAISFRLTVSAKDSWIDQVKKIPRDQVKLPEPKAEPELDKPSARLREGDTIPAFSLTDQDGDRITAATFRGRPLMLTFIFTRCPMPNFCPRITSDFSELQGLIKADNGVVAKTQLLGVTLDPAFDTPQILKDYGAHSNQDPKVWSLATGDPHQIDALTRAFSVYRQNEGGTISHGLATALISPEGKIVKIWRGNAWTPEEVIAEIRKL